MTKVSKLILILSIFTLATSCSKKDDIQNQEQTIEVKQEDSVENNIDIKATTFASKIVLDNIVDLTRSNYSRDENTNFAQIEQGNFDVAIIPGYLGPYFFSKTGNNIEIAAISLLDNTYVVSDTDLSSEKDLVGKNILLADPVNNLSNIVDKKIKPMNLLLRLNVEYYKDMNNVIDKMSSSQNFITLLQDPYFSKIIDQDYYISDLSSLISINDNEMVSEILIVNKDYLIDNDENFKKFLDAYKKTSEILEEETEPNIDISSEILKSYDLTDDQAQMAIKRSHPIFIDGEDMEKRYKSFLKKLNELDESLLYGLEPSYDLYYDGQ